MNTQTKATILKNQTSWYGYADLCEAKLKIWRDWAESIFKGGSK